MSHSSQTEAEAALKLTWWTIEDTHRGCGQSLHIVKVSVPAVTVVLQGKTADGVLCVKVRLHFSAKFFFGKLFEQFDFIIDTDITSRVKPTDFFMGIFRVKYESCKSEFKIAKIICPVNLLANQVRPIVAEVLKAKLPTPLCQAVELVIRLGSIDFQYTSNVLLSIGTIATVHYRINVLPLITSNAVAIEFKVSIRTGGRIIVIPGNVSVVRGNSVCLGITQAALHVFLTILVRVQPREFICTPEVFSGAIELTDAIAGLLINQKCPKCSTKSPLKITLTMVSVPVIILEPKRTIVAISVEIGIFAKGPSGNISGLFVVRANLKLNTQISVHDCKLILTTQLTRFIDPSTHMHILIAFHPAREQGQDVGTYLAFSSDGAVTGIVVGPKTREAAFGANVVMRTHQSTPSLSTRCLGLHIFR